jgi:glyoxylase-like metal-dependent hydrolase (beta-lactamase superfamily II)
MPTRTRRKRSRVCHVHGVFSERHILGDDFEVIPTPGHTSGATTFLWDTGDHRVLFTGDSIEQEGDEWVAVPFAASAHDYAESLELIRGLKIDVIAPWAATLDGSFYALTDERDARRRIDEILERMRSD